MQVILNGKPREVRDDVTVAGLLETMGLSPLRVAVEVNESLVPRRAYDLTRLHADDAVEVVTFVGGG